jgi:arabinofuranosyltransferase
MAKFWPRWAQGFTAPKNDGGFWRSEVAARRLFWLLAAGYILWALQFIRASSFVIGGERHYCLFDDAMISMRYAWNFWQGNGLVWNIGQRVEGYTNLLWVLVMAPAQSLGVFAAPLAIQALGLAIGLATFAGLARVAALLLRDDPVAGGPLPVLAAACGMAFYPLQYFSLMGMETGLLALLMVMALRGILASEGLLQKLWPLLLAATLGLRPDALIPAVLLAASAWFISPGPRSRTVWALALLGLGFAGLMGWRFWYYGQPFPNTYTLKLTGMPLAERLANGWGFLKPFMLQSLPLAMLAAWAVPGKGWGARLTLWGIPLAVCGYQIWVGGDPWAYWRIPAPFVPWMGLLAALTGLKLARLLPRWGAFAGTAFVLLALVLLNRGFGKEASFLEKPYQVEANRQNVIDALELKRLLPAQSLVAVHWAGAIPYFSGLPAHDCLGKSDRRIALLSYDPKVGWAGMTSVPGHNKYDLDYSYKTLQPAALQYPKWYRDNLEEWVKQRYAPHGGMWVRKDLLPAGAQ